MIVYMIIAILGAIIGRVVSLYISRILSISYKYLVPEIINGLLYVLIYNDFGFGIFFVAYSILGSILLTISLVDYATMHIPNRIIIFGTMIGLIYLIGTSIYYNNIRIMYKGIMGMLVGVSVIGGFMILAFIIFREQGMGMGDLKLLAMIGLFVGVKQTLYTIFIAIILGGLYGIVKFKVRGKIPFGPFISVGVIMSILWGDILVGTYLKIIGY